MRTAIFLGALGVAAMGAPALSEPTSVERIASFETGTFLESIAVRADGDLLVVDHTTHRVLRVSPSGESEALAQLPDGAAGVALDLDGTILVTSGFQEAGGFVTVLGPDGTVERIIDVPGSRFLNGAALLGSGVFLVADSVVGRLFRVDIRSGDVSVWLQHDLLAADPDRPRYPGANGVKVDGTAAFVTNSGLELLVRVPIAEGLPGEPEILVQNVVLDDIAIAADGTIYGATHPDNSVVRIEPDGVVTTLATAVEGMTGATAVAFGRTAMDADQLYAVTSGGVYFPPPTGIVPALIARLDVEDSGADPLSRLATATPVAQVEPLEGWLVRCDTAEGDVEAIRAATGPAYLAYLEAQLDRIAFAGQYYSDGEAAPSARYYIVTAPTAASARQLMQASPYFREGLYQSCDVGRFRGLLGGLLGGVAWPDTASSVDGR